MIRRLEPPPRPVRIFAPLPASKSISNRALMLQAYNPKIALFNLSTADDTLLLQSLLQGKHKEYHCKNAGTVSRFLLAWLALNTKERVVLTGSERLQERPVAPLVEALNGIGCRIEYQQHPNKLPVAIQPAGPLSTAVCVDNRQSSQFLSALLLNAAAFPARVEIGFASRATSWGYVESTLKLLEHFQVHFQLKEDSIVVDNSIPASKPLAIEPDYSSLAQIVVFAALPFVEEVSVPAFARTGWQPDEGILQWVESLGIQVKKEPERFLFALLSGAAKKPLKADLSNNIDLVPALAALCRVLEVPFRFTGLHHLQHKESNRFQAIVEGLKATGAELVTDNDCIAATAYAAPPERAVVLDSRGDHRLAMAWALLALWQAEKIAIHNPEVTDKSFPGFWGILSGIGIGFSDAM